MGHRKVARECFGSQEKLPLDTNASDLLSCQGRRQTRTGPIYRPPPQPKHCLGPYFESGRHFAYVVAGILPAPASLNG
jgi:hypothetical protein